MYHVQNKHKIKSATFPNCYHNLYEPCTSSTDMFNLQMPTNNNFLKRSKLCKHSQYLNIQTLILRTVPTN